MKDRSLFFLRFSFLFGAVADGLIALVWFLIALGEVVPQAFCRFENPGIEYRFAMYLAALFMAGWTVILFWGGQRPDERKGLLLITAVLLIVSIVGELAFFQSLVAGSAFWGSLGLRVFVIVLFSGSYFFSIKKNIQPEN